MQMLQFHFPHQSCKQGSLCSPLWFSGRSPWFVSLCFNRITIINYRHDLLFWIKSQSNIKNFFDGTTSLTPPGLGVPLYLPEADITVHPLQVCTIVCTRDVLNGLTDSDSISTCVCRCMQTAEIWKIVWPGALTRQRAAGKTDAVMKRSLSRVGSLLKVDGDIFITISKAVYSFLINYLITASEGFSVKFQTKGWNFCFMDRASGRGP